MSYGYIGLHIPRHSLKSRNGYVFRFGLGGHFRWAQC
jgi:hypothetical protein